MQTNKILHNIQFLNFTLIISDIFMKFLYQLPKLHGNFFKTCFCRHFCTKESVASVIWTCLPILHYNSALEAHYLVALPMQQITGQTTSQLYACAIHFTDSCLNTENKQINHRQESQYLITLNQHQNFTRQPAMGLNGSLGVNEVEN